MWKQPELLTVINKQINDTPCIDCGCTAFLCIDNNLFCQLCGKIGKIFQAEQKID